MSHEPKIMLRFNCWASATLKTHLSEANVTQHHHFTSERNIYENYLKTNSSIDILPMIYEKKVTVTVIFKVVSNVNNSDAKSN